MHESEETVDLRNLTFRKLTVVRVPSKKTDFIRFNKLPGKTIWDQRRPLVLILVKAFPA